MKPCHTNRNYIWPILCLLVWYVGGGKKPGFWVQVTSFPCCVLCSVRWLAVEIQHQRYQSALVRNCQERQENKGLWTNRIFSLLSSVKKKKIINTKKAILVFAEISTWKTQASIRLDMVICWWLHQMPDWPVVYQNPQWNKGIKYREECVYEWAGILGINNMVLMQLNTLPQPETAMKTLSSLMRMKFNCCTGGCGFMSQQLQQKVLGAGFESCIGALPLFPTGQKRWDMKFV